MKNFSLIFLKQAQDDILNTYLYYKKNSQQTANKFKKQISLTAKQIAKNPLIAQKKDNNYWAFPLNNFPYIIFYTLDQANKKLIIVAVFNTHQNTDKYPS